MYASSFNEFPIRKRSDLWEVKQTEGITNVSVTSINDSQMQGGGKYLHLAQVEGNQSYTHTHPAQKILGLNNKRRSKGFMRGKHALSKQWSDSELSCSGWWMRGFICHQTWQHMSSGGEKTEDNKTTFTVSFKEKCSDVCRTVTEMIIVSFLSYRIFIYKQQSLPSKKSD